MLNIRPGPLLVHTVEWRTAILAVSGSGLLPISANGTLSRMSRAWRVLPKVVKRIRKIANRAAGAGLVFKLPALVEAVVFGQGHGFGDALLEVVDEADHKPYAGANFLRIGRNGGTLRFAHVPQFPGISVDSNRQHPVRGHPAGRVGSNYGGNATVTQFSKKGTSIMAVTPSKDYKRREREQRKLDKRMAREAAKAVEQEAQQAAAQAAAVEAAKKCEADLQAQLEADFEAELEAERQAQKVA